MGDPRGNISETTPQWNSEPRSRVLLYLLVALALAALAGVLTYLYLEQIREESVVTGQAVVANRAIRRGTTVTRDMVELRDVPSAVLPAGAITDPNDAAGRRVVGFIAEGEVLLRTDLIPEGEGPLSYRLPDGRWAIVLPTNWLVSPFASLAEGDRIDLMAYQQGQAVEGVGLIAEDIEILSLPPDEEGVSRVTLAVNLEQASSILYAQSNGFQLLGLLRSQGG